MSAPAPKPYLLEDHQQRWSCDPMTSMMILGNFDFFQRVSHTYPNDKMC